MKFSIFQDSRVGARPYNQDRIGHWYTRDSLLLVLADGMGGHLMGEVAAQIAVDYSGFGFPEGCANAHSRSRPVSLPRGRTDPCRHRRLYKKARSSRFAAHDPGGLHRPGWQCVVDARRGFAPVPDPARKHRGAHARPHARAATCRSGPHPRGSRQLAPRAQHAAAMPWRRTHAAHRAGGDRPPGEGRHPAAVLRRLLGPAHAASAAGQAGGERHHRRAPRTDDARRDARRARVR